MPAVIRDRSTGSYRMPSPEHAAVSDVMHPGVISCGPESTAGELARAMVTHHVHCIMVLGIAGALEGEHLVWGVVTDQDLLRLTDPRDIERTAEQLVRQPIISVEPTTALNDARDLMLAHGVSHVLVVDRRHQRPVGVLSSLDIIGAMAWGDA